MNPRYPLAIAAAALLCAALRAGSLAADAADPVAVKVGDSTLLASQVSARIAAMPRFQLLTFGKSPAEIRRAVLERVIVPDLLRSEEGKRRKLADTPRVRERLRELHARSLEDALKREVEAKQPIAPADVQRYFDAHRARLDRPERIRIWRILLGDEALAKQIIAGAAGSTGISNWSKAAREQSLDKATAMRQGDLGFVHADGQTDVPSVRVDPALFAAAERVADGELVPEPIKEGDRFAVIWRRGTLAARTRSLADEEPAIRELLLQERVEQARQRLIDELRQRELRELNPAPLDDLVLDAFGSRSERLAPSATPRVLVRPPALPSAGERGLR